MKRITLLATALLTINFGGGGAIAAESCEIWVGFEKRSLVLFEGQSSTLTVTADFQGPIADDYVLEVQYQTDPAPFWQQNQPNEAQIGSHGGTSTTDYTSIYGRSLQLTKGAPSGTITVEALIDDEEESNEKFHVNLSLPWSWDNLPNHQTREESCNVRPAAHFHRYGYFATIHIRDN